MLYPTRLKQEGIFTNKMIADLIIPILIEQIMIVAIGIADTIMVSYVGETAVAGISLITTFDTLIKVQMSALAIGGSIVISQYIGKSELYNANKAMKIAFYSVLFLAFMMSVTLFIFYKPFLALILGKLEDSVMKSAQTYFSLSLFTYPFFAIYYVASASFRAMGNSRVPMVCSLCMMLMNLILKAILIYRFNLGVFGAGISTLISVIFIGIVMIVMMCKPSNLIHIEKISRIEFDFAMIKRILKIGIPNSIESGMFQLGILFLQRLIVSFGTASIVADAIVRSLMPISNIVGVGFGLVVVTVVGQCMGAGKVNQAVMYTKHIIKLSYILLLFINLACIVLNGILISCYNLSQETSRLASSIFYMYCIGIMFFYPSSYILPNALRASGDTKFTMTTSILTMFGARIGLAFILGKYMSIGLFGVWLAMQVDWIVRSMIFVFRFKHGNWKKIKVV